MNSDYSFSVKVPDEIAYVFYNIMTSSKFLEKLSSLPSSSIGVIGVDQVGASFAVEYRRTLPGVDNSLGSVSLSFPATNDVWTSSGLVS